MTPETIALPGPIAPDGYLWVCHACGRTERNRYGVAFGWDASCMLNASLHRIADITYSRETGRVAKIDTPIAEAV